MYKLLLVTDREDVLETFTGIQDMNRLMFDPVAPVGSVAEALAFLRRPGADAIAIDLSGESGAPLYAHLDANGVFVRPGQRVRRGQRLGLSGNTGFSTGPHLHFVIQANRGMRLESLPFRMFGPGGVLRFHDPTP